MRGRAVAVALLGIAYVAGSHWLVTEAPGWRWSASVVIDPMLALLALWAVRQGLRWLAAMAGLGIAGLAAQAALGGGFHPEGVYVAQRVVIHAALAAVFALTLRPGRESLITALARRVHGGWLSPAMEVYSRKVTVAWTVYFIAMAVASLLLFAFAPFDDWAVFANLVTPATMVLLFVGEYALRYRLHPEFERASLGDALRAYSQRHAAPAEPRP